MHVAASGQALAQLERTHELLAITDALPTLVCHVDAEQRYTFVNSAYERWFGVPCDDVIGRRVSDVLGPDAYAAIREHVEDALRGRAVRYEAYLPYRLGGERYIEATYVPRIDGSGRVAGFVGLIADISERKQDERLREAAIRRVERLMKVTTAIADAVTPEQVYTAVVDQVAVAVQARSVVLWRVHDEERGALLLLRGVGYEPEVLKRFARVPLDTEPRLPVLDAVASGQPLWIDSQAMLLEHYPHLVDAVGENEFRIACLPVSVRGRPLGVLGFTFRPETQLDEDERNFLMLVARYSGQALERLRLLEAEQASRAHAELLYGLAAAANAAERVEQVFEAALDAIGRALGASRSSILAFDRDGVMRFKAWRGLSDGYRRAVEGHSPWTRDTRSPQPVAVADALGDASLAQYHALFRQEGIGALGFFPLVAAGRVIGKFMVYYEQPRAFAPHELELATAIANHVAAAIDRFAVMAELQRTVHFNEMFTGMLGHDLRNPLGAIMTAAQLALTRGGDERLLKPLSRIVTSGTRMARMIDQLLDFTRVRVGAGIPIERKRVALEPLLGQVLDELEDALPSSRLQLECRGDLTGTWDGDRLLQVFSNLLANAAQHGIALAGVRVDVDGRDEAQVQIDVHNMGAIPAQLLPRLFEPMTGGEGRRDRAQGLGLGLFISREIVKAHGGSIEVSSSEAAGTTFRVSLPRTAGAGG